MPSYGRGKVGRRCKIENIERGENHESSQCLFEMNEAFFDTRKKRKQSVVRVAKRDEIDF